MLKNSIFLYIYSPNFIILYKTNFFLLTVKASELFIKCLENEGINYIFGVPGEENADFCISLDSSKKINFILTRHEQSAAFMAESYGKLTGKVSCCLSTLGPGASNLLTGVADANMDHAPVLVITGQGSTDRLHKQSHQIMDVCEMFKPVTKWTTSVRNPYTIPEIVKKAVRLATYEKPGAVHIELPEDIAKMDVDVSPLKSDIEKGYYVRRPAPDDKILKLAFELINQSESPIILAGNGAIRDRSSKQLRKFCERTKIPVVSTFMGKGSVDYESESFISTIGLGATDYGDHAVMNSDLVITLGYDMYEYHPKLWNQKNQCRILHIDFEPAEVDEYYMPKIEVVGDIAHAIWKLNSFIDENGIKNFNNSYYEKIRKLVLDDLETYSQDNAEGLIKPQKFLYDLRKHLDSNDILISDVGAHKMWIGRNYNCNEPNTCLIPNGFCSMGFALPGSISASLINPSKKIFSVCGDAGFMMNIHEMETAKRLNSNIVVIIWEDKSYGLIKWKQKLEFGKTTKLDFDNPNWELIAKSFSWNYIYEDNSSEILSQLQKTKGLKGPTLFVIPIDYSENFKLSDKLDQINI
ncbi:MAG: acetolactate synthase large subunit [Gammaproteobacteria bacterium]|nr:acetolactate synthase large subunit [Gammaproteobacteria bacterium]